MSDDKKDDSEPTSVVTNLRNASWSKRHVIINKSEWRKMLLEARLTERELAFRLGSSGSTPNRWVANGVPFWVLDYLTLRANIYDLVEHMEYGTLPVDFNAMYAGCELGIRTTDLANVLGFGRDAITQWRCKSNEMIPLPQPPSEFLYLLTTLGKIYQNSLTRSGQLDMSRSPARIKLTKSLKASVEKYKEWKVKARTMFVDGKGTPRV